MERSQLSTSTHPIRLVMFTSDDCIYCPPIEAITFEVVGAGMASFVHVSTIDVDDDPDSASRYGISSLPTLMINEQIVLQGGMDDDSVRELLWNTLLTHAVENEESVELSKQSLLILTMNFWDSLNRAKQLRTNIGDFIHIGPYQLTLLSLYSLDPLVPLLLYKAGQQLGITGMMQYILNLLEPRLGKASKRVKRFKYLAEAFELYFSDREMLPTYFSESAEIINVSDDELFLRIQGLASAAMGIDVGENMCDFTAGQLAGVTTAIMGTKSKCIEVECTATGHSSCLFQIKLLTSDESDEIPLPTYENKMDRVDRRQSFYEVIHELTLKLEDSLLIRKPLRTSGDYIHISALQPIVVSLKLLDEFTGSILYSGGRELGIFGPGKDLLYRLVNNIKGISPPVNFDLGIELLHQYLSHPATALSREWGKVNLSEKNPDHPNRRFLTIEEYGAIAGIHNIGKTFCDFLAGFISGRLTVLIGKEAIVKEVECQGTGAIACKFEITYLHS
jgi:predicted hydrocarbon binding protein